jgi:hypothetical protein
MPITKLQCLIKRFSGVEISISVLDSSLAEPC